MKRLVFDIDGVLADFIGGFNAVAHTLYGVQPPQEWTSWNIEVATGLTARQVNVIWQWIQHHEFWRTLPVVTKNHSGMKRLQAMVRHGLAEATFVTSRRVGEAVYSQTFDWLCEQGFKRPCVLVSSRKGSIVWGLGDVAGFYDDHLDFCADVKTLSPGTLVGLQREAHLGPDDHTKAKTLGIRPFDTMNEFLDVIEASDRHEP